MDLYEHIDEAMMPMYQHLETMFDIEGEINDEDRGIRMQVSEVSIESPLQLDIAMDDEGNMVLGSSPPLYYLDTGIMPVFHKLRLRVIAEQQPKMNMDGSS